MTRYPPAGAMRGGEVLASPSRRRPGPRWPATWPTANAGHWNDGEGLDVWAARMRRQYERNRTMPGPTLGFAAHHWPTLLVDGGSWRTPIANDGTGPSLQRLHSPYRQVGDQVLGLHPQGRLNPAWVEALMGFPPGWTVA